MLREIVLALAMTAGAAMAAEPPKTRPAAEVLAASPKTDWKALRQDELLYIDLPKGRVVVLLAPAFAPDHIANVRLLARAHWFDGAAVVRVQDNFVAQWGDPTGEKPLGAARKNLAPEYVRPLAGLPYSRLFDPDPYAPQVGFSDGFAIGADERSGKAWLTHCYGVVGVGRENAPDSGNGAELYAIIGHAPRGLDRNLTVVGRVVQGIELLSSLPRGTGEIGFYETAAERTPIARVRLGSDLPAVEQIALEALRTDSETFATLVEGKRNRRDDFYAAPAGGVDVCNVTLPVRRIAS